MVRSWRKLAAFGLMLAFQPVPASAGAMAVDAAAAFVAQVDRRLDVPPEEFSGYARLAEAALARDSIAPAPSTFVVVVDRHPDVQALMLMLRHSADSWTGIGAAPVSTGRPGSFDHFATPLGVFAHSPANPDFRAEGTRNANGIRGYGARGMRVFDFGWQLAAKGWGDGEPIDMRLQMHATDPDALEPRLGSAQSKGCIRIPATLNRFLDRYGILDGDYLLPAAGGRLPWVLAPDREPWPGAGRYLVVVESSRQGRPAWSPAPAPRPKPGGPGR